MGLRGGADKSLARPGREKSYSDQTRDLFNILSTKLNTILSPLLKLLQATQKNSEGCPSNLVSAAANFRVGRKMAIIELFFFSVQGTGGSPAGSGPENKVGDQDT